MLREEKIYKIKSQYNDIPWEGGCYTQKGVNFKWTAKCEKNFQELKVRLTSAPILAMSSEPRGYVVYTDASKLGLGCMLM